MPLRHPLCIGINDKNRRVESIKQDTVCRFPTDTLTAYGLSIFFYVKAQRYLGAARTSAYYAAAPFAGVLLSVIILREMPSWSFYAEFILMLAGVWLIIKDEHSHNHIHEELTHHHVHSHDDLHHNHPHDTLVTGKHFHEHTHEECTHNHPHTPDIHHNHVH